MESGSALFHVGEAAAVVECIGIKSDAVVLNNELELVRQPRDPDIDLAGFGMTESVVERFFKEQEKVSVEI
jgi:hypothetical protein